MYRDNNSNHSRFGRQRFFTRHFSTNRNYKELVIDTPRIKELSEKYNLLPKTIAYLRSALGEGKFTKDSLIHHITISNFRRLSAIDEHKVDQRLTDEQREKLIRYTQINIDFRKGIISVLERLSLNELDDILN